jgi:hypothetical protein
MVVEFGGVDVSLDIIESEYKFRRYLKGRREFMPKSQR